MVRRRQGRRRQRQRSSIARTTTSTRSAACSRVPTPGGLGLDHEFLSDATLGTMFVLYAFLGMEATEDGVLDIVAGDSNPGWTRSAWRTSSTGATI